MFKAFCEATNRPRVFYRGTNIGDTRRIQTGDAFWDGLLFASDHIKGASFYGSQIEQITAKPNANILYEGSREFRSIAKGLPRQISLLNYCSEVAKRAQQTGYDAVWFQRQTDVGTAIINPNAFTREPHKIQNMV